MAETTQQQQQQHQSIFQPPPPPPPLLLFPPDLPVTIITASSIRNSTAGRPQLRQSISEESSHSRCSAHNLRLSCRSSD